jgi:TonB family protein
MHCLRLWFSFWFLWAALLVGCATEPPTASHLTPPPEIASQTPRTLPKWHIDFAGGDPYPDEARRDSLVGRVLVAFQIDPHGQAVSEKVLAADAAPILQRGALNLIRRLKFDVSGPDTGSTAPYYATVRFCLPSCRDVPVFSGTEDIMISGSPLRY